MGQTGLGGMWVYGAVRLWDEAKVSLMWNIFGFVTSETKGEWDWNPPPQQQQPTIDPQWKKLISETHVAPPSLYIYTIYHIPPLSTLPI